MMPRRDRTTVWLWTAALAAGVVLVSATAPACLSARRVARLALDRHRAIAERVARLEALRAAAPGWASHSRGDEALTPRLSAALAACGLSSESLASVSADAEASREAAGVRIVTRRTSVILSKLTLPALGRFLDEWRSRAPEWTITSIDLAPDSSRPPTPGADLPLRVSIVIETSFALQPDGPES